jgi:GTPase involved in cell partitioning and DNA repair
MKTLFILSLALSLFGADIERLEGIVEEITTLRSEHESCKAKLLEQSRGVIVADVQANADTFLQNRVQELEESLQAKDILAGMQAREIATLKQKNELILKEMKKKEALSSVVQRVTISSQPEETLCKDTNPFPKLMMKQPKEK